MPSYRITLLKGKTLKNGKHPIVLRLVNNRKSKIISLGFSALENEWVFENQRYSSKVKNYKTKNAALTVLDERAEKVFYDIKKNDQAFSFNLFTDLYTSTKSTISLFKLYDIIIDELEQAEKVSNRAVYKLSLNHLKEYTNEKDLDVSMVDYNFLKGYENHLFKKGNSGGGINLQMRTLRAVLNEAIRRQYMDKEDYPFSTQFNKNGYSLAHLKSLASPRALSEKDMKKIKKFKTNKHPNLIQSYYYFLFSYYARGINFADMAKLTWNDVYDGRIVYNRSKTSKALNLKVSDSLQTILDYFKGTDPNYIFPILDETHQTETQKKYRIKKCLKAFNKDLKAIGKSLKISIKLTSYVARHTYATTLKRKGFSTEVISQALGHSELATTKAYLEKFSNDSLDKADKVL